MSKVDALKAELNSTLDDLAQMGIALETIAKHLDSVRGTLMSVAIEAESVTVASSMILTHKMDIEIDIYLRQIFELRQAIYGYMDNL